MSQVATLMKLGSTSIILSMLEDGWGLDDFVIADPVSAVRLVSHDCTLSRLITLADGRQMTALQMQMAIHERASAYLESVDDLDPAMMSILGLWGELLEGLESNPSSMANMIDWIAKKALIDGMTRRHGWSLDHPRLRAIDLQYHDMDPDRNLHRRIGMMQVHPVDSVLEAVTLPPVSTRAYFRGECVRRWPDRISSANWDSIVFLDSSDNLRRVAMMDPLKGSRDLVEDLLTSSTSVDDLLLRLGDDDVQPVVTDPGW